MTAEYMVDAALAGFDQGEFVTIPALPDPGQWETYEAARHALKAQPVSRYARRPVSRNSNGCLKS